MSARAVSCLVNDTPISGKWSIGCSVAHGRTEAAPAACVADRGPREMIGSGNEIRQELLRKSIIEEALMTSDSEHDEEATRHERAVRALTERTGAPVAEVRALFAAEVVRLTRGATVRSYLVTRATSNVLAKLRNMRGRPVPARTWTIPVSSPVNIRVGSS
jgi:hypothetical protein